MIELNRTYAIDSTRRAELDRQLRERGYRVECTRRHNKFAVLNDIGLVAIIEGNEIKTLHCSKLNEFLSKF